MKIVLIVLAVLAGLVALMALIGLLLPRDHVAARAASFKQPPAELFAVIRDFAAAAAWRGDVERVELLEPVAGRVRYRETGKQGKVTYELMEEDAPRRMVVRIADEDLPYGGTWTFELAPRDGGTELAITERGFVTNPLFRFLSHFVFSASASIDGYLKALGKKLGEDVVPRPEG